MIILNEVHIYYLILKVSSYWMKRNYDLLHAVLLDYLFLKGELCSGVQSHTAGAVQCTVCTVQVYSGGVMLFIQPTW